MRESQTPAGMMQFYRAEYELDMEVVRIFAPLHYKNEINPKDV